MSNTVTKKYIIPYVLTHMIGLSKIEDTSFWQQKKRGQSAPKSEMSDFLFFEIWT